MFGRNFRLYLGVFFFLMSLLLTAMSMEAAIFFYSAMFGYFVAVNATVAFELLRLGSLVAIMDSSGRRRTAAIILYAIVVLICASVSTTSFMAQSVRHERELNQARFRDIVRRVEVVKRKRVEQIQEAIRKLEEKIDFSRRRIAMGRNARYYTMRIQQREQQIQELRDQLAEFQKVDMEDEREMLRFLRENAPLVGQTFPPLPQKRGGGLILLALREMWHMDGDAARRIVVLWIVFGVEAGILLLALLSGAEIRLAGAWRRPSAYSRLVRRYGRDNVQRFRILAAEHYRENGTLIPQSRLTENLRPIRREVASWSEELQRAFLIGDIEDNGGNGRTETDSQG